MIVDLLKCIVLGGGFIALDFIPDAPVEPAQPACAAGTIPYAIEVEDGLPEPGFVAEAQAIIESPDGWVRAEHGEFCLSDKPGVVVLLAWPDTVDDMCSPLQTHGEVSCHQNGRVVINWKRWLNGSSGWSSLEEYRHYVVTHEMGHALGMGHKKCPDDPKEPTPVMRQQTSRNHRSCPRNSRPVDWEVERLALHTWASRRFCGAS